MTNVLNKNINHRIITVTSCSENQFDHSNTELKLSSNESQNKIFKNKQNNNNILITNRSSSLESSETFDSFSKYIRPITARSCPTPVQNTETKSTPKIKLIGVSSKNDESEEKNEILKNGASNGLFNKTKSSSTKNLIVNGKTKLDNYLEYSISPFTTRYEIIGNSTKNLNINPVEHVRKSKSINNLKAQEICALEEIILPTQIQPYTINENEDHNRSSYLRITNNLFCGNINSIKNERKLCKFNIEYLVDMTNLRPDELNRQTLGKIPCNCQKHHSRLFISIEINQTDFKSLFNSFCEVNKLIQKSRKSSDKRVLIFGKEVCSPQVICAAAQYLMVEYEMSVETALQTVVQKNFSIICSKMDDCYLKYLNEFEKYLKHISVNIFRYTEPFEKNGSTVYTVSNHLKAKRDMFEENFEFFNENLDDVFDGEDDEDDESIFRRKFQSSLTNLKSESNEKKKRSSFIDAKFSNLMQENGNGKILKQQMEKKIAF